MQLVNLFNSIEALIYESLCKPFYTCFTKDQLASLYILVCSTSCVGFIDYVNMAIALKQHRNKYM